MPHRTWPYVSTRKNTPYSHQCEKWSTIAIAWIAPAASDSQATIFTAVRDRRRAASPAPAGRPSRGRAGASPTRALPAPAAAGGGGRSLARTSAGLTAGGP